MSESTLWLILFLVAMAATVLVITLPTIIRDYRKRHQK